MTTRLKREQRAERIEVLAKQIQLPKAALEETPQLRHPLEPTKLPSGREQELKEQLLKGGVPL
jgi:hypothetical protein